MSSSLKKAEIEKFSKDAPAWWDEDGPFAPLHRLNPARMGYIKSQICEHFKLAEQARTPLKGLKILDIGCGGGLVCEPLARLGADVTGIDADNVAIEVARKHAAQSGLEIYYRAATAETLLSPSPATPAASLPSPPWGEGDPSGTRGSGEGEKKFDVVLALEIIEHVKDPAAFVKTCAGLAKPSGLVIFSTLNRTAKSFALGIVAAEYILNWVPRGTHEWKKFIRPSELANMASAAGLTPENIRGLVYDPIGRDFRISEKDIGVNYFLSSSQRSQIACKKKT